jgi:phage N-6-adenine-methyltransferase
VNAATAPVPTEERLSAAERGRLEQLEGVIERGLASFIEVGEALVEIRDQRLYRSTHESFDSYCLERWGFRRAHAHRLVQSAKVIRALSPTGDTPAKERHARELAPLLADPDQLREAWSDARERATGSGEQLTAGHVREAVESRLSPERLAIRELSGTDQWETPTDLYDALDAEFRFELDVCALPHNAKCDLYYTPEQDGLCQPWLGRCWMNPPYGPKLRDWVGKAHQAALEGATVVALVPASTETAWWWDYCRQAEIRFLRGRLRFSNAPTHAPFASAVIVFGRPARVIWWDWQAQGRAR